MMLYRGGGRQDKSLSLCTGVSKDGGKVIQRSSAGATRLLFEGSMLPSVAPEFYVVVAGSYFLLGAVVCRSMNTSARFAAGLR